MIDKNIDDPGGFHDKENHKFRRITELPGLVFLELIEELKRGSEVEVVNSVTVYEFDEHDKICHFDCYLQKPVDGRIAVFPLKVPPKVGPA